MLNSLVAATHPNTRTIRIEHLAMQDSVTRAQLPCPSNAVLRQSTHGNRQFICHSHSTLGHAPPLPAMYSGPWVQSWHPLLTSFSFAVHLICISLCFPRFVSSLAFCAFLISPVDDESQNRIPSTSDPCLPFLELSSL